MKLKTLKDLDLYIGHKEMIKKEAIKWVKCEDENATTDSTDAWIKHFFNITEEDLKEEFKLTKRSFIDRIKYLLNQVECIILIKNTLSYK